MNLITGRSEYPKLAKHLDYDFPPLGYNPIIVKAFERFTAYHPTEKLAGFGQEQFQAWLGWDSDPIVKIMRPMEIGFTGLSTGIIAAARYVESYEKENFRIKVKGALTGQEVYQVTAQLLGQLVMWAIYYRDYDKRLHSGWTAEEPAQAFLDYLYGANLMFWS